MYSILPVPTNAWKNGAKKHILLAFPLVGVIEGLFLWLFIKALQWIGVNTTVQIPDTVSGFVLTVFLFVYTGGIHFDGYLDTSDAVFSHAPREKRLKIMKDPHVGGAAVLWGGLYLLGVFSAMTMLSAKRWENPISFLFVFTFSRILSGYLSVALPKARKEGMLSMVSEEKTKWDEWILLFMALVLLGICFLLAPGILWLWCLGAVVCVLCRIYFTKSYGGITGDLAGWFLSINELLMLLCLGMM